MEPDLTGEEIAELLNQVKQRVHARYPSESVPIDGEHGTLRVPLANLIPLLHARDAAQAKMASIGAVNPRPGGLVNNIIQAVKRSVSRGLGWFVRDQITFNRQMVACIDATLEALNETKVGISAMGGQLTEIRALRDMRIFWEQWRAEWENNLRKNELAYLRGIAELQDSFFRKLNDLEASLRRDSQGMHTDFKNDLARTNLEIQQRVWTDLERVRMEYDRIIQTELRLIRQRLQAPLTTAVAPESAHVQSKATPLAFDYARFAERFRGAEDYVRRNQRFYLPYFREYAHVLDIGCGRGEFLELLRDNQIHGRGIELSEESVAGCRLKGLEVEQADLFEYLEKLPEEIEEAIFSAQVVEHIDPATLPEMVRLCASRVRRGGLVVFETPNPECLAIFATHFYLDPTHHRPVPHPLLAFYMEEAGLGRVQVQKLAPAVESFPELTELPKAVVDRFFGGMDYAIFGWKL